MRAWFERNRGHLATFIASVGVVGLLQWWGAQRPGVELQLIEPTPAPTVTMAPTTTPAPLAVFVSGEVAHPDVYFLPPDSRVEDALAAAGGLTAEADPVIVNRAEGVSDGMHIHVPARGTAPTPGPITGTAPNAPREERGGNGGAPGIRPININTASPEELDQLPGIGPVIAQRIVDYRTANGPFHSIDEVKLVTGIGDKLFTKIKDLIMVK
ncbi:MAG TPA: hypothetical protein DEP84_37530 [Chloroflexi bacterium]|nr:hypothetical protein [Chloroflexota bacterium]